MSNKVKLGEVLEVKRGTSLSGKFYSETGEKIRLTLGNFDYPNGGFKNNTSKTDIYFNGKLKPEFILKKGDIITPLTEQASGLLGETARIPEDNLYIQSGDIGLVIPNSELLDNSFAYYLLPSPSVKKQLGAGAQQTKIRHTSPEKIKDCEVWIPEMPCQKFIGTLLDSINAKISTNNRINAELESMAKTIYDYWFTQFDFPDENGKPYRSSGGAMVWNEQLKRDIPQKWTLGSISDCVEKISTGLNPRDNFVFGNGNIRYITVKNLTTTGSLDYSGCDMIDEEARALVHRRSDICIGDILFASIAPLGRCFLIQQEPTDWDINESVFSIRCKADMTTPEFLYLYFRSDGFIRKATNTSTGSIFKGIRINTLLDTKMIVPDLQVCKNFTNTIKPFLAEINNNSNETTQLIALRDWLLPMLMNGQIGFKDKQEEKPQIKVSGFEQWLAYQGFAARGDVDMEVLRNIYEAMDNDDK